MAGLLDSPFQQIVNVHWGGKPALMFWAVSEQSDISYDCAATDNGVLPINLELTVEGTNNLTSDDVLRASFVANDPDSGLPVIQYEAVAVNLRKFDKTTVVRCTANSPIRDMRGWVFNSHLDYSLKMWQNFLAGKGADGKPIHIPKDVVVNPDFWNIVFNPVTFESLYLEHGAGGNWLAFTPIKLRALVTLQASLVSPEDPALAGNAGSARVISTKDQFVVWRVPNAVDPDANWVAPYKMHEHAAYGFGISGYDYAANPIIRAYTPNIVTDPCDSVAIPTHLTADDARAQQLGLEEGYYVLGATDSFLKDTHPEVVGVDSYWHWAKYHTDVPGAPNGGDLYELIIDGNATYDWPPGWPDPVYGYSFVAALGDGPQTYLVIEHGSVDETPGVEFAWNDLHVFDGYENVGTYHIDLSSGEMHFAFADYIDKKTSINGWVWSRPNANAEKPTPNGDPPQTYQGDWHPSTVQAEQRYWLSEYDDLKFNHDGPDPD
jgi:hypothetical protein